jgi:hypothetical protein
MRKLITLLVLGLLMTSCGTFQFTTLNHDPMYPDQMKVDVIDNEFQLARKFRTDDRFRWDFAQFAMRQDLRWNYDFYFNNRMYRSAFASPFDFYWNSNQYWYNWASNSHFNMGFNHWDTFGFYGNGYGYGYGYYGNYWNNGYYNGWYGNGWGNRQRMNDYAWNNRDRGNVSYNIGRRGSTMSVRDRIGQGAMIQSTKVKRRIVNNSDEVIDKELIKLKRNNTNIRIYTNPNNVPPVIIRNNNSNSIRNYNRPENNSNNNNIRNNNNNNSRPVRTYTPPTRSSSPPVINNSSSNGRSKGSIKN